MGYTTCFTGSLYTDRPVSDEFMLYLNRFAAIRHVERDEEEIKAFYPNWAENCFRYGELGIGGQYFVGASQDYGDKSVVNINSPAPGVPGLWCDWVMPTNSRLTWSGQEKFYDYFDWLAYLIEHFFDPEGYVLNGEIRFQGEDIEDFGIISVKDNKAAINYGIHAQGLVDVPTSEMIAELERRGYDVTQT